ncbi:MAG: DUF924 family protein [Pseudomonadota bacterium]
MRAIEDPRVSEVLEFWFGDHDGETVPERQEDMWFKNGRNYDGEIRARFAEWLDPAGAGGMDSWAATPAGRLALIVVLDQFPRHIHRETSRQFVYDAKAREICVAGLESGHDQQLRPLERAIFYLPLEHAEDRLLQERCQSAYTALAGSVGEANRETYQNYLHYASLHRDIIVRFGHFPHRSALLGRSLTAEEKAFLQEPDSSFL